MVACGKLCGDDKGTRLVSITNKQRHCTDVLMLLLFICSWGIIGGVYAACRTRGSDPDRIIRPVDFKDNICGVTPGYVNAPYGAFPYPWGLDGYKTIICVQSCDLTNDPKNTRMSDLYYSSPFLGFCVPVLAKNLSISIEVNGEFNSDFLQYTEQLARGVGDVWYSRNVIAFSIVVALIIVMLYCVFLRACAKTLVYSLLVLVLAFGLMFSQVLLNFAATAEQEASYSPSTVELLRNSGYAFMVLTGLFTLICFALRNQIDIAIEVTRESAKALLDMPFMIIFPVIPAALLGAYVVAWIGIGLHIYSVTSQVTIVIPPVVRTYTSNWALHGPAYFGLVGTPNLNIANVTTTRQLDQNTQGLAAAHLFHLLWTSQFFFYLGYLIFAGAAADWYFSKTDEHGRKLRGSEEGELSRWPVLASTWRAIRYHMGTVAVCAFIIAVVKFIRMAIRYLERQTQGKPPNPVQKALFCLIQCFLRCLECCLDKINKYSLSWTAVYGDGFCIAVCSSFALVWRNLFRVAAVNTVSSIIFGMGKLAVALVTAALVAYYLRHVEPFASNVTSPLAPAMLCFFIGYILSGLFFVVFSSTIDTLFICFLIDSEVNKEGEMMAPKALQKLVGKYEKRSKNIAVQDLQTRSTRKLALPPEEQKDLEFKGFDSKSHVQNEDDIDG